MLEDAKNDVQVCIEIEWSTVARRCFWHNRSICSLVYDPPATASLDGLFIPPGRDVAISACAQEHITGVYRPRRPQSSPLYRLLEEHFERFLLVYEEQYESRYGPLRSVVKKAVYRFLECGILEYGFARVVCKNCKSEFVVGLSCKTRMLCPSCQAKRLTLWSQWLGERLLAKVPHRMITLTVPKRIRPFFLWDRKLLGLLARCAAETIKIFLSIFA
jgi:hypothetical protein